MSETQTTYSTTPNGSGEIGPDVSRDREITTRGRILKIRCLTKDEATAIAAALGGEGVVETLDAVGRARQLTPAQRRLAAVLAGDEG